MNSEITTKTFKGLIWTITDLFANQGMKFVIQIILARMLLPKDFGMIGMIMIVISLSQALVDGGFQNALIRKQRITEEDLSTVFFFNVVMGFILYGVIFLLAPFVASFYQIIQLTALLRVLGLTIVLNAICMVQRTLLTKQMEFKKQAIVNILATIVAGVLAIRAAYFGFGVWSLIIQTLINQFIQVILFYLTNRWYPRSWGSKSSLKEFFQFGWNLTVASLLNTLYDNSYFVIIGKFFQASTLGYYTNAQKLRDVVSSSITSAIQKVTYPALSHMQDKQQILQHGYRQLIKYCMYFTAPLVLGLAAIAPELIPIIFGEKWAATVPYYQILSLAGVLLPLHAINLNILQVKGRSDLFLRLEIIKKVVGLTSLLGIILLQKSVYWVVWNTVFTSVCAFFINSYYSKMLLDYSTFKQIKDAGYSLLLAFGMALIVMTVPINTFVSSLLFRLVIKILLGICLYSITNLIFNREDTLKLWRLLSGFYKISITRLTNK